MGDNDYPQDSTDAFALDRRTTLKGLTAAGLGVSLGTLATGSAAADHQPADKISAAGATMELMEHAKSNGGATAGSSEVTLLSGSLKTSNPTDLLIQTTVESGLYTDIKTKGNDSSTAEAGVSGWIEIDGEPVVVTSASDQYKVVFNNRSFSMKTSNFENEEAMIELFLRTRASNAFNWITTDVGSGVHDIAFKADIDVFADGNGEAKALVGPRTLIVEPTKLANVVEI